MQPVSAPEEEVGALVLVRSTAELPLAIEGVNALLSRQYGCGDVLAILAGAGLEPRPYAGYELPLRESVALSGLWSVSWFQLGPFAKSPRASDRRCRLLDLVLTGLEHARHDSKTHGTLFPVFTSAEACRGSDPIFDDLADRYPQLTMGGDSFVHDPLRGGLLLPRSRLH